MAKPEQLSIPVTVIGGYLGSGKTTLVNHLLRNADGRRLAIMVNEFGDLAIDEDLIEAQSDDLISLAGGCVCCSFGNDLIKAMQDLGKLENTPDQVILETSGVAIPGAIAGTVSLMPAFTLQAIAILADAETVRQRAGDKYLSDTILRQLADANIVLLNKCDLISAAQKDMLREWLAERAGRAPIVETSNSKVMPEIIFQDFGQEFSASSADTFHHAAVYVTETLDMADRVDVAAFCQSLLEEYPDLVRAKGFAMDPDGVMKTIQITGHRVNISDAPVTARMGLVLIRLDPER